MIILWGQLSRMRVPEKKLHLGLTDILYENHLRERGSWKEGHEGLWKLALLIILVDKLELMSHLNLGRLSCFQSNFI